MTLFLSIIKTIGLVLLGLLIFVLFLLMLVLFVPVRYKVLSRKEPGEDFAVLVRADVTFLLHIINFRYEYPKSDDENLRGRVFFFKVYPTKSKYGAKDLDKSSNEDSKENCKPAKEENCMPSPEADITDEKEKASVKGFILKAADILKNLKEKIIAFGNKIKEIFENIEYYLNIINSPTFQRGFELCKTELAKLIKIIKPRKIKGEVFLGDDDPATCGMYYGAYSLFYSLLGRDFVFYPVYGEKVFYGNIILKGRITLFGIIVIAANLYFDKDIKKLIKQFKKES